MRKELHLIIIYMVALLTVAPIHARKQKQLVILHTNDTHSCVMPQKETLADSVLAGRGGYLRRVAMIKEERQKNPNLLLFDSGDFSQGSSYYTMFKGEVEIGLMNEMGYDAATIGNHEFDFGLANMTRLFKAAKFPIVCSNYDFADTELKDIVKPYIILKRQGVKIGVFALCPEMKGLVAQANYGSLRYLNPMEVAQQMVDLLREREKCDLVICISHLGWSSGAHSDEHVIENTTGIDIVLGGHTHTYMKKLEYVNDKSGRPVAVDQNGKNAAFVGRLVVDMEKK